MKHLSVLWVSLALVMLARPVAEAEDYSLFLRNAQNEGVAAALVTLHALDVQTPSVEPQSDLEVRQRYLQFDPGVLIAPVGSAVSFPNDDDTGHHVYSFSSAKVFDLRLIAGGQSEAVRFDQVGPVAIGCNIHDNMVGFIHVVDTPWAVMSDPSGLVIIPEVPDGRYRLQIHHPELRGRDKVYEAQIELSGERVVMDYELDLRRSRQRRSRY